jgi:Protein of unknown function (DUF3592)
MSDHDKGLLIAFLFFFIGGIFLFFVSRALKAHDDRAKSWTKTSAVIKRILSERQVRHPDDANGESTVYFPEYEYEWQNKTYIGTGDWGRSNEEGWKVNDAIEVLVNPEKPEESKGVDQTGSSICVFLIYLSYVLLSVSLIFLYLLARSFL